MKPFIELLEVLEDINVILANAKRNSWKLGLSDIDEILTLAGDIKDVVEQIPHFDDAAAKATAEDWKAFGGRAVADLANLLKIVAGK